LNEMFPFKGTPQGVIDRSLVSAFTGNFLVASDDRRIEHNADALLRDSSTARLSAIRFGLHFAGRYGNGRPQIRLRQSGRFVFRSSQRFGNRCKGVLFIENQDTYTAAAAGSPSEALGLALVYAAGFRGTAARVRNRLGALLHYAGPGLRELASRFDAWWYDGGTGFGPAWFWGDLDFAGMQILKSLRSKFEDLEA
jgi:hypothetical protein